MFTTFSQLVSIVAGLEPGQRFQCSPESLSLLEPRSSWSPFNDGPSTWSIPDRVLGNVVGSGYGWFYEKDSISGRVTFGRLEQRLSDGFQSFVEPDRLYLYDKLPSGLYRRNSVEFRR